MDDLRKALLAIEGIAAADLDGDDQTPAGVRIRLAPGANAEAVGGQVQQVLSDHGMRSHMTPSHTEQQEQRKPEPQIPAPRAVRGLDTPPPPPGALRAAVGAEVVRLPGIAIEPVPALDTAPGHGAADALAAVAVEEARSGVTVSVTTVLGKHAERTVAAKGPMVDIAIVEAVGAVVLGVPPEVVAVNDHLVDGTEVVLIVVEHADGTRRSGSSAVAFGRPFAVGIAAWQAVSDPV